MKRAALYIRVSTEEQARHGFSLAEQRADLESYAHSHGYAIYDVYADEGNTARKALSRRKELQRLLVDVQEGKIDIIVLKCLDRWFRNVADYYKVQEILDAHGVGWECSQEDYNTTTTNGRLMLNLKLTIAQNESDQTSDRIKYVHAGLKRQHIELNGRYPFGYLKEGQHLVVDESKRQIVEFVFAQILAGSSTHSIASKVYDRFRVALTAKRVWRMLRNPTFKGERYGMANYCPAIIPGEVFDRVQNILSRNQQPRRIGRVYLFSGKIICPSCGSILLGHSVSQKGTDKKFLTYFCGKRYTTGRPAAAADCQYTSAVAETVVERFLLNNLQQLLEAYSVEFESARHKTDYQAKAKTVTEKLRRLKDLYVDGLIDKEAFKADHARLQKELEEATLASSSQKTMPPLVSRLLSDNDFMDTYQTLSKERKRELWQTLIKSIKIGQRPPKSGVAHKDFIVTFY